MAKGILRVAAAQCVAVEGDVAANVATVVNLIGQAAAKGARFVAFPELMLSGYALRRIAGDPEGLAFTLDDPRLASIAEACARGQIAASVSLATRENGTLYLSLIVFAADGSRAGVYRKRHLYGTENDVFTAGTERLTVAVDGWTLGFAICYDTAFPDTARLTCAGCDVYVAGVVGVLPDGYESSRTRMPTRARDNGVFVVFSNQLGPTEVGVGYGAAGVWAPDGTLITEGDQETSGVVVADLDPALLDIA
jgi:5-aminopentanamidase